MNTSKLLLLLVLGLVVLSGFVRSHAGHHHHSDSDHEEEDEHSHVLVLNEDNFSETTSETDLVLIKFYAPWCGHCKKLAPAYKEAAEKLSEDKKVKIAKVDCTQEEHLCRQHKIEGYPTLILYNKGKPEKYEGGRSVNEIVDYLQAEILPPVTAIETAEQLEEFKKKNPLSVVGFFDNDHDDRYTAFTDVVAKLKRQLRFAAVVNKDFSAEFVKVRPAAVMFRDYNEPKVAFEPEDFSETALKTFVSINLVPLIGEINAQTYKKYEFLPTPLAYLFIKGKEDNTKVLADMTEIAKKHHGAMSFCWVDMGKFAQQATYMGLSGKVIPALSIEKSHKKFNFPEATEFTAENVGKFVHDVVEGIAEPFVKSDPIPESNDGPVKVVVAKTYNEIVLDASKDVFVEFYAPWCGHCKNLEPIYNKLGEALKDVESVVIAKIDATTNDVPEELGIKGFPTILLFKADDKENPIAFNGMRDSESTLAQFIHKKASIKFELPAALKSTTAAATQETEDEAVEEEEEAEPIVTKQEEKEEKKATKKDSHDEL